MELRYRPYMCALVSVDAYMGIPWQLEGDILYIPFFQMAGEGACTLEAELYVGCPSGELYAYKKAGAGQVFAFDKGQLMQWKNEWIGSGYQNTAADIVPAAFAKLYAQAEGEAEAAGWT